ncbi:FMN-dependent NADH-azoreductase [Rothia dentocariosa]|uniref:FMN-dependent NADH-azoreductase n=1 Tax=Rothia dentocariosa TaxID=2047 RepID=UPI00195E0453|nr:NAD(P)H-dependent oxidoreductase [Rothia dentocariosa]VTY12412.1 FMN-dependent NADH-azoreductase 1 [Rothia dentocariosa]
MQTLIINAHPDPQNKTAYCTNRLVDCLTEKLPDASVLNLYNEDIPELTAETLPLYGSVYDEKSSLSKREQQILARRAELIEQFKAADRLIIAMPMHNFSVTSRLKDYVDNIIMGGQTFQFSENGPQGLMGGHKALLVQSSGSVYSTGPLAPWEQSYPFLRTVFGMLGFDSTDIVRAEGTTDPNIGSDVAVERACAELEQKLPEFLA